MSAGLIFLLAGFVGSFVCAPAAVRRCQRWGLVAAITARHAHSTPTPHGVGIILPLIGIPLGLAATAWGLLPDPLFITTLLLSSIAVAWVGWQDDKHDIPATARLSVHLLAVTAGVLLLPPLFDLVPTWLEKIILILAWGWFLNLFNFMDGADGQISTQATLISLGLALLVPPLAPLALLICGLSLGFLRINLPPAKGFLGDVGSTWLGYMLGGLLLLGLVNDTWNLVYPLATLTLFVCLDATSTLIRRLAQGHHPLTPHKTFWFHRALALGLSHTQLLIGTTTLTCTLLAIALVGYITQLGPLTLIVGLALVSSVFFCIRHRT